MKIILFYLIPKSIISHLTGLLSRVRIPSGFREMLYGLYVNKYSVVIDDSKKQLSEFNSFSEMFIRELKSGIRPISENSLLVSPVDGTCANHGVVKDNTLIQAKNIDYSLQALFNDSILSSYFGEGDSFWTFYLAPGDYHRIHSPVQGQIISRLYVPGHLFPVNAFTRNFLPNLFLENERVITLIKTSENSHVAVIKVAALNVGGIELKYEDQFRNRSLSDNIDRLRIYDEPISVVQGEELGSFYLGSTVIVISNIKNVVSKNLLETKLKYGERIVEDV